MTAPLLEARGIELHFGGVQAAKDVNLQIFPGEFYFIIGQNGAGKSTFLNICTGYLRPQRGQVLFQGRSITGLPPREITRAGIARAFQHPQLFTRQSVLDNLRFAAAARGPGFWQPWRALDDSDFEARSRHLLELCGLDSVALLPAAKVAEGFRKLLDVALALALQPTLVLLDEPTSGVSSADKHAIMTTLTRALRKERITAVFVEHDMEVVRRFADRVGVWENGQILTSGAPADVLEDPLVAELVL